MSTAFGPDDVSINVDPFTSDVPSRNRLHRLHTHSQSRTLPDSDYILVDRFSHQVGSRSTGGLFDVSWMHSSPIHDLKDVLSPMGVEFMDKSLSGSCQRTKTCYSPLRILTRKNGMNPSDTVSARFYRFYQDQPEMNLVDAFVCFHPAAMCELYMPFNRSMIIIASTRYELARFEPAQWHRWNENLKQISRDPKNVIAANNRYDAEYIHYFTGIRAIVLPSFCGYTKSDYQPTRKEFLIAPIHNKMFQTVFMKSLRESQDRTPSSGIQIVPIRAIYDEYQYSDLTNHPAIIHIPYQVSVMSLFEQYRMNIPLFFPSLALLTEWHYEQQVVSERTWDHTLFGIPPNRSHIQGVLNGVPDPNNDRDREAIRYWLAFSDFYQWPHILYFESTDDLVQKLMSTDFHQVSQRMKKYNRQVAEDLQKKWTGILKTVRQHSRKFQN